MGYYVAARIEDQQIKNLNVKITIDAPYEDWVLLKEHLDEHTKWPMWQFAASLRGALEKLKNQVDYYAKKES